MTSALEPSSNTIPTINTAINTLAPGCNQRPHRHNGAAVTLAIQGEGIHSMIDGKRVDWSTGAALITPATLSGYRSAEFSRAWMAGNPGAR